MKDAFIKYLKFEKRLSNHTILSYDKLEADDCILFNLVDNPNDNNERPCLRSPTNLKLLFSANILRVSIHK